jgi:hypothetical protein
MIKLNIIKIKELKNPMISFSGLENMTIEI